MHTFHSLGQRAIFLCLIGCVPEEEKEGACEFAYPSLNEYYCTYEEYESDCTWGTENYYFAYDSCADLGYSDNGDTWFTSSSGSGTPGAYGAWGSGGSGGVGGSSGSVGSTPYTFTCDVGGSYTVDIPNDGCESASKRYAEVFGCNYIDDFYSACVEYLSCYGQDTSQCDGLRY